MHSSAQAIPIWRCRWLRKPRDGAEEREEQGEGLEAEGREPFDPQPRYPPSHLLIEQARWRLESQLYKELWHSAPPHQSPRCRHHQQSDWRQHRRRRRPLPLQTSEKRNASQRSRIVPLSRRHKCARGYLLAMFSSPPTTSVPRRIGTLRCTETRCPWPTTTQSRLPCLLQRRRLAAAARTLPLDLVHRIKRACSGQRGHCIFVFNRAG